MTTMNEKLAICGQYYSITGFDSMSYREKGDAIKDYSGKTTVDAAFEAIPKVDQKLVTTEKKPVVIEAKKTDTTPWRPTPSTPVVLPGKPVEITKAGANETNIEQGDVVVHLHLPSSVSKLDWVALARGFFDHVKTAVFGASLYAFFVQMFMKKVGM